VAKLRESPDDLVALVGEASDHLGIPQEFVEKDYWVTELLRSAANPVDDAVVIFKGGTSLSKAFGLIERFSEDVGILVSIIDASFGKERVHKILKRICTRAGDDLDIDAAQQVVESSQRGVHRDVRYIYPARLSAQIVTEGVLLEMGCRGGPLPRGRRPLQSMIKRYAIESHAAREEEYEEFAPFEIDVLSPERTLVEKLALLHRLSLRDSGQGITVGGRHLYDVYRLLSDHATLSKLRKAPETVARLAADADAHSEQWEMPFEPRPASGYGDSPAFDPSHACGPILRAGFEAVGPLIYGATPTFAECIEIVQGAADVL
jgi:hypothetical protein